MRLARPFLGILVCAVSARAAAAQGTFVVRLGRDTSAVERVTRTRVRLEADGLFRQPRTTLRHVVMDFAADGRPARVEITLSRPDAAGATLVQRTVATFTRDSVFVEIRRDTTVITRRLAAPPGIIPVVGGASSSWVGLDLLAERLRSARGDSIAVPVYTVGAAATSIWSARVLGRDSVWLYDGNNVFHARVDGDGHILGAIPISGTQQFTVDRVASADVAAVARGFATRDARGDALGLLSPRDTVRAAVAGAAVWIDYGRPAKRGRVLFGSTIAPWGEVWRTGANAATQFRTDRALEMGGVVVQPGTYTLWTIPSPTGWKLLINGETGQWGTDHHAARDLFQLDMRATVLAQPVERFTIAVTSEGQGGVLRLQWDTTEASIPFTVR
jgi:hypothetical protein